jgi:hypothetical protein
MDSHDNLDDRYLDNTVTHVNLEILLREHNLTHPDCLERYAINNIIDI